MSDKPECRPKFNAPLRATQSLVADAARLADFKNIRAARGQDQRAIEGQLADGVDPGRQHAAGLQGGDATQHGTVASQTWAFVATVTVKEAIETVQQQRTAVDEGGGPVYVLAPVSCTIPSPLSVMPPLPAERSLPVILRSVGGGAGA